MRTEAFLSYNMTSADANNADGIVPVGRQFDFIGDVETELMILNDGDESLCLGYNDVKFYDDVYIGDMLNFKATMLNIGNTSRTCLVQTFKVASKADRFGGDSEMIYYDEPKLITEGKVTLVVKKHLQRGVQPDGIVKNPWREI